MSEADYRDFDNQLNDWIKNVFSYPHELEPISVTRREYGRLHAEALAERIEAIRSGALAPRRYLLATRRTIEEFMYPDGEPEAAVIDAWLEEYAEPYGQAAWGEQWYKISPAA